MKQEMLHEPITHGSKFRILVFQVIIIIPSFDLIILLFSLNREKESVSRIKES